MEKAQWPGIMIVREIWCHDGTGKVLWRKNDVHNTLHVGGEQFILNALFTNGQPIPSNYFLGLDNRPSVSTTDDMSSLVAEPNAAGYLRQPVSSSGGFTVTKVGANYQAVSSAVTFRASGAGWGPVSNLFLASTSDTSGVLIATAVLGQSFSVTGGNMVSLTLGMSLVDIPAS